MRFREEQLPGDEADAISQAYEALSRRVAKARAEQHQLGRVEGYQLRELEFHHLQQVYFNLPVSELVEHSLINGEGGLAEGGALCVKTAPYSSRSPQNTLVVGLDVALAGAEPQPTLLSERAFRHLYQQAQAYVQGRSLYVIDGELGSGISVRVVTELASQALFVKQLLYPVGESLGEWSGGAFSTDPEPAPGSHRLIRLSSGAQQPSPGAMDPNFCDRPSPAEPELDSALELDPHFLPLTLIVLPGLKGEARLEAELQSEVFNALYPMHRLGLIGGSRNGEEIWAALLGLAEAIVHQQDKLLLWEAAIAQSPTSAPLILWLGPQPKAKVLPKASLLALEATEPIAEQAAPPTVTVTPVFAGQYGPVLAPDPSPDPPPGPDPDQRAMYGFGSLLENVVLDPTTGIPDPSDRRWSPTPKAIRSLAPLGHSGQLQALVLGLDDPEAIFPPLARLSLEQAQFYYLCGYGNWLQGDGQGLDPARDRNASFRTCFAPEMTVAQAIAQVEMFGKFLRQHRPPLLLRNTATALADATTPQLLGQPLLGQPLLGQPLSEQPLSEQPLEKSQIQAIPLLDAAAWRRQIGDSSEKRAIAQQLFQRFNHYADQFFEPRSGSPNRHEPKFDDPGHDKIKLPESIRLAGPQL